MVRCEIIILTVVINEYTLI